MKDQVIELLGLKSKDKLERIEGFTILSISIGALLLSIGIGLSILNTKGISAILAMLGSVWTFLSTIGLIIIWLMKEWRSG